MRSVRRFLRPLAALARFLTDRGFDMAEKASTFEELMKKVEEFEKTVLGLLDNIKIFKSKLIENKSKYGQDTSKWPNRTGGAK